MTTAYQILRRPLVLTEKGTRLKETENKYLFEVPTSATKNQIRAAMQQQFPSVHVVSIRTLITRGKDRRMGRGYAKAQNWKKAIVTLREGEKIELFEAF